MGRRRRGNHGILGPPAVKGQGMVMLDERDGEGVEIGGS